MVEGQDETLMQGVPTLWFRATIVNKKVFTRTLYKCNIEEYREIITGMIFQTRRDIKNMVIASGKEYDEREDFKIKNYLIEGINKALNAVIETK